ncbi:MAG: type II toxin-antitoxin system RelE/ParE family toxin [Alphaproteobacteria bacterium]
MPWRVEFVSEAAAQEVDGLAVDVRARFLRIAERIEAMGLPNVGEPRVKHLKGKLWEMRMTGRDGIARSIYVAATGQRVVVLHSFVKKSQKTPLAALTLATERAKKAGLL